MYLYELDKIDWDKVTIWVDGINTDDYPDFCDAYAAYGTYEDRELTEGELDFITSEHYDFVYETLWEQLF